MATPFEEGETFARAGQARSDNPFPEGSSQHDEWDAGYRSAAGSPGEADDEDFDVGAKD